jgi:hypothetical protein
MCSSHHRPHPLLLSGPPYCPPAHRAQSLLRPLVLLPPPPSHTKLTGHHHLLQMAAPLRGTGNRDTLNFLSSLPSAVFLHNTSTWPIVYVWLYLSFITGARTVRLEHCLAHRRCSTIFLNYKSETNTYVTFLWTRLCGVTFEMRYLSS